MSMVSRTGAGLWREAFSSTAPLGGVLVPSSSESTKVAGSKAQYPQGKPSDLCLRDSPFFFLAIQYGGSGAMMK